LVAGVVAEEVEEVEEVDGRSYIVHSYFRFTFQNKKITRVDVSTNFIRLQKKKQLVSESLPINSIVCF